MFSSTPISYLFLYIRSYLIVLIYFFSFSFFFSFFGTFFLFFFLFLLNRSCSWRRLLFAMESSKLLFSVHLN